MYIYEKYKLEEERKEIYNRKVNILFLIYRILIPLKNGEEIIIFY